MFEMRIFSACANSKLGLFWGDEHSFGGEATKQVAQCYSVKVLLIQTHPTKNAAAKLFVHFTHFLHTCKVPNPLNHNANIFSQYSFLGLSPHCTYADVAKLVQKLVLLIKKHSLVTRPFSL